MVIRGLGLNRFERLLFRAALVLGGLLLLIRVGAVVILGFLHHH